jgi:hypothetical protein
VGTVGQLGIRITVFTVGAVLLALSLVFTTPHMIGPLGVTLWFVLLYMTLANGFGLLLYTIKSYLRVHTLRAQRLRYSQRQGLLLSGLVTGALALSSLKQLSLLDVILLGLILLIIEVYVRFRWP